MTLLSNDPMTQLAFSVYENKRVFAVLLGSGLCRAAEIPTGWEITPDLIRLREAQTSHCGPTAPMRLALLDQSRTAD